MELFRSLGALAEPPSPETQRLAEILELGSPPGPAEFTDLFESKLYPYASVYLDPTGKLGGEARDRISGFWRALGLDSPDESDHLTVMLSFYARMRELEMQSNDSAIRKWRHARQAFMSEHLLSWLPFFCDKLADIAAGFYRAWGVLLEQSLRKESEVLPPTEALPLHLRQGPTVSDPRNHGGEEFLDSLLAPVRSGIILVRPDLERAGEDLDLGVRIGERRYVTEALLAQDSVSTLTWLADEADRWTERHESRSEWTGTIARFWADRSRHTSRLLHELAHEAATALEPHSE